MSDITKYTRTLWLHVKTQNLYRIDDMVIREEDLMPCVLYHRAENPEAPRFFRPWYEFFDGRFTQFQVDGVGGQVDDQGRPVNSVTAKTDNPKRGKLPASSFHHSDEDDLIPAPKTGRPALDADENRLKVGDFVQPLATMKSENRKKLPVGAGPYEIKRVVEDDYPQIFFDSAKGATGWYPAVFEKTDAPYDTLE